jgi:flagellar biosynthetic protein FliQ
MTPDLVVFLGRDAALMVVLLAGPILAAGLIAGLIVSVVQAVTQIQEMTLTFVPKLIAVFLVLMLGGNWMLGQLVSFTTGLLTNLNAYGR